MVNAHHSMADLASPVLALDVLLFVYIKSRQCEVPSSKCPENSPDALISRVFGELLPPPLLPTTWGLPLPISHSLPAGLCPDPCGPVGHTCCVTCDHQCSASFCSWRQHCCQHLCLWQQSTLLTSLMAQSCAASPSLTFPLGNPQLDLDQNPWTSKTYKHKMIVTVIKIINTNNDIKSLFSELIWHNIQANPRWGTG